VYGDTTHVGLFYDFEDPNLLLVEAIQVGFILAWVTVTMAPFFAILRCVGMFRVDPLEEEVGLDVSHHGGAAYDITAPDQGAINKLRESKHGNMQYVPAPTPQESPSPQYTTTVYEAPGSAPASAPASASYGSYGASYQSDSESA